MVSLCFSLSGFQEHIEVVATKQAAAENHCIDLAEVVNVGQRICAQQHQVRPFPRRDCTRVSQIQELCRIECRGLYCLRRREAFSRI